MSPLPSCPTCGVFAPDDNLACSNAFHHVVRAAVTGAAPAGRPVGDAEWWCEGEAIGVVEHGICSPDHPIHRSPCGWRGCPACDDITAGVPLGDARLVHNHDLAPSAPVGDDDEATAIEKGAEFTLALPVKVVDVLTGLRPDPSVMVAVGPPSNRYGTGDGCVSIPLSAVLAALASTGSGPARRVMQESLLPPGDFDPEDIPGEERGDCLRACVASLLGMNLAEVPHFVAEDDWWGSLVGFLSERNLAVTWVPDGPTVWNTPYIATGRSPRNPSAHHAVIEQNGELVHDPHPDGSGLDGVREGVYLITPLDPAAWATGSGPADPPSEEVARLRHELAEQRSYHEAFRPEVVAEVAVHLSDETDWEAIAEWCGGTIRSASNPSGEYDSWIDLPGGESAGRGCWITLGHNGAFRVRANVEPPRRASGTPAEPPADAEERVEEARAVFGLPPTEMSAGDGDWLDDQQNGWEN